MLRWRQALPCLCASGWCVATSWPSEPQIPLRVYVLLGCLSIFVFVPLSVIYLNLQTKFHQFPLYSPLYFSSPFLLFFFAQFVFLFSSIMISSIVSCSLRKFFLSSYAYSNIFRPAPESKEGPILRVVGSENSKLGNYKVNGRQGKAQIRMDPRGTSINSLPRFPRSRFEPLNQKIEFNLHIPRTDPSFFFNRLFFRETFLRISIFFFFLLN